MIHMEFFSQKIKLLTTDIKLISLRVLEVMFPWMLNGFVLQAYYKLKRKIPHHRFSEYNNEFGSAIDDFQLEIVGLFVYLYTLMAYKI